MSRTLRLTAGALVMGLGWATAGQAQTSANAAATATAFVSGIAPLTASTSNNLNFGSVTAGTVASPANLASDAARFAISGQPSTPVTVTFVLPTVLTGPGATTIPISFGGADGLEWNPYPSSHTTFNPNGAHLTSLDGSGNLTIGITGSVAPPLGSTTGSYTGTITMTVAY